MVLHIARLLFTLATSTGENINIHLPLYASKEGTYVPVLHKTHVYRSEYHLERQIVSDVPHLAKWKTEHKKQHRRVKADIT